MPDGSGDLILNIISHPWILGTLRRNRFAGPRDRRVSAAPRDRHGAQPEHGCATRATVHTRAHFPDHWLAFGLGCWGRYLSVIQVASRAQSLYGVLGSVVRSFFGRAVLANLDRLR